MNHIFPETMILMVSDEDGVTRMWIGFGIIMIISAACSLSIAKFIKMTLFIYL